MSANNPPVWPVAYYKFPCKGCEERTVGCHAKCERYNAIKDINDARKAEERKHNEAIHAANDYTIRLVSQVRRRKLPQR